MNLWYCVQFPAHDPPSNIAVNKKMQKRSSAVDKTPSKKTNTPPLAEIASSTRAKKSSGLAVTFVSGGTTASVQEIKKLALCLSCRLNY